MTDLSEADGVGRSVDERISTSLEELRRAPVSGETAEVLEHFRSESSDASGSFRELLSELAPLVEYDLIAGATRLILRPSRSIDIGDERRILLGAFSIAANTFVLLLRFERTGGAAVLTYADEVTVRDDEGVRQRLVAIAEARIAALRVGDRVLEDPGVRAAILMSQNVLRTLDDPEGVKRSVRAMAAVEDVEARVEVVDLTNQTHVRTLGRELAGYGLDLIVVWNRSYEQVPFALLPELPTEQVIADAAAEGVEAMSLVLAHASEESSESESELGLTEGDVQALRNALGDRPLLLVVVSGNQRQEEACARIEKTLSEQIGPGITLQWISGWSGGSAKGILQGAEGLVWSELVGHTFSEALRREADQARVPHTKVVGKGTGRGATTVAVIEAVQVAVRRRTKDQ